MPQDFMDKQYVGIYIYKKYIVSSKQLVDGFRDKV